MVWVHQGLTLSRGVSLQQTQTSSMSATQSTNPRDVLLRPNRCTQDHRNADWRQEFGWRSKSARRVHRGFVGINTWFFFSIAAARNIQDHPKADSKRGRLKWWRKAKTDYFDSWRVYWIYPCFFPCGRCRLQWSQLHEVWNSKMFCYKRSDICAFQKVGARGDEAE